MISFSRHVPEVVGSGCLMRHCQFVKVKVGLVKRCEPDFGWENRYFDDDVNRSKMFYQYFHTLVHQIQISQQKVDAAMGKSLGVGSEGQLVCARPNTSPPSWLRLLRFPSSSCCLFSVFAAFEQQTNELVMGL